MKFFKSLLTFGLFVFFLNVANAYYNISSYEIKGDIQIDGTIDVKEKIGANFFTDMHGIERILNRYYSVLDSKFQVFYENIKVNGDNFTTYDEYGDTVIRIGDKDITIYGEHDYDIDYSMYGVIRNFSGMGYSELYWNVIGYDWDVDIGNVNVELNLPKSYTGLTKDDFLISLGNTNNTSIDDFPGVVSWDENNIYITYTGSLQPYNGITLSVKFPNNYFEYDHEKQASLFVGYLREFKVDNNIVHGIVHKDGSIDFKNIINLSRYELISYLRGRIPYKYLDNGTNLLILKDLKINSGSVDYKDYDTTESIQSIDLDSYTGEDQIISEYSMYGLIKPFTGEDESWKNRISLPLPIFGLNERPENIELKLEFPESEFGNICSGIYREDIEMYGLISSILIDDFYDDGGELWCEDNVLYLNLNGLYKDENFSFVINLTDLGFEFDEELLGALEAVGNGDFYFNDSVNRQSLMLFMVMVLSCGGFMGFMKSRYSEQGKEKLKYIVEYDAPKGMDPSEAGALIDDKIDGKDITALIYQWAAAGYIEILKEENRKTRFYIKKLRDLPKSTKSYQLELFKDLFRKSDEFHFPNISSTYGESSTFQSYIRTAKSGLKKYINEQKWYKSDFDVVDTKKKSFRSVNKNFVGWTAFLRIIFYCSVVTIINSYLKPVRSGLNLILIIGIILILTSYKRKDIEQNTDLGNELLKHCLGYKDFLMKVDKDKFETLLKEDPLFVEKALPYAVVFGIESKFIKNITPENLKFFDGDISTLLYSVDYFKDSFNQNSYIYSSYSGSSGYSSSSSSYSSSSGFSSGSSFSGGHSSGGGGGGGGGRGW